MADSAHIPKNDQPESQSESEYCSNESSLSILPPTASSEDPLLKPSPVAPSKMSLSPSSGRHPSYRGIRCRSGKWVSEIREPRKTSRIWLGTYPTPEMAAAAYDVAALALKGPDAALNFPDSALSYVIPANPTAADIRAAAANAAASRACGGSGSTAGGDNPELPPPAENINIPSETSEFIDEEDIFDMPNLLADMAEGMLISPPRMKTDDSPEKEGDNLWSYPRN
ncbi:hypothetical protein DCAR_0626208 [Daucus carota subsp. sativus]|uniref:AP2/ERF domain-containing protein n=1 Tax=Daucus carota subsp. sativus TaxID=79200 RepID=A0A164WXM5_DAUCS|nr:PREDICTED: ethylene-responsive transcription factor ERF025-like [Daucus carota subsp. sativus]WOH06780.1 hypothetical protein DCAR_0626208 [Daucus carota subsp. sativus]